jgi:hypothetical protein
MFVIKPCPGINIGYGVYGRDPDPWDEWDDYEEEDDEDDEEDCEDE